MDQKARLKGFEPPAHGLEGRCSIQLSYRRPHSRQPDTALLTMWYIITFPMPCQAI